MDVEQLVKRAGQGDAAAFGLLYEAYVGRMRGVGLHVLKGQRDDADDVVHDAFIIAMATIGRLRDPKRFGEWLAGITANLALRHLEAAARCATVPLSAADAERLAAPEADDEGGDGLSAAELMALIDRLPEGYRRVLHLYVIEGLSHKEIGRLLDIAPHTSSSQLHRAKAMLRQLMAHRKAVMLVVLSVLSVGLYRYFAPPRRDTAEPVRHDDRPAVAKGGASPQRTNINPPATVPGDVAGGRRPGRSKPAPRWRAVLTAGPGWPERPLVAAMTDSMPRPEAIIAGQLPPHPAAPAAFAATPTQRRAPRWKMLLAGSAGPTLVQSAYKLIAAAGSGEVNPDGSSGVPEGISTWEEYYDYLTTHHAGTTAADTLALMDLAKHNSGNITEQAHHDAPLTFGLSLSKTLGDRWSLETGLQYTLLRSTFTMGSGTNHISRRQTVGYVGLPLRLSYRFADVGRRLSAYGSAGLTLHVPAGGRSREYLVTDSVALPTGTTHLSVPFGWSVSANVGLQYRLTPGLSLYLEPTLGYHFPAGGSVSTSWTARPLTFSVPLGVRFTW